MRRRRGRGCSVARRECVGECSIFGRGGGGSGHGLLLWWAGAVDALTGTGILSECGWVARGCCGLRGARSLPRSIVVGWVRRVSQTFCGQRRAMLPSVVVVVVVVVADCGRRRLVMMDVRGCALNARSCFTTTTSDVSTSATDRPSCMPCLCLALVDAHETCL